MILCSGCTTAPFFCADHLGPREIFPFPPSGVPHWGICAPAASLGYGRRLSGGLTGVEPYFPVIRQNLGRPIPNRQVDGCKAHSDCRDCSRSVPYNDSPSCRLKLIRTEGKHPLVSYVLATSYGRYPITFTLTTGYSACKVPSTDSRLDCLFLHLHGLVVWASIYSCQDQTVCSIGV